jgi:type II secretory pathway component PulM
VAEQHVRALQRQRSQFDSIDYAIMEVIALDVGRENEPARTALRTIAERAGCHYNTVAGRIAGLAERGYVTTERDGKYSRYSVHLEGVGPAHAPAKRQGTEPAEGEKTVEQRLQAIEEGLSHLVVTISELSHRLSHIVTRLEQGIVTEDREVNTPPTPPTPSDRLSAGQEEGGEEEKPAIEELAEYFCQITGRKMPRKLNSAHADTYWWEPLVEIYHQHDTFLDTKRAMYAAVQYASDASLTVTTPHSLRNLAVASARDHSGYRDRDGTLVVSGR